MPEVYWKSTTKIQAKTCLNIAKATIFFNEVLNIWVVKNQHHSAKPIARYIKIAINRAVHVKSGGLVKPIQFVLPPTSTEMHLTLTFTFTVQFIGNK